MKKPQNNFTTPEESKRLLELGVPADSADCYYDVIYNNDGYFWKNENHPTLVINDYEYDTDGNEFIVPCWSVGRLQEIAKICAKEKEYYYASVDTVAHQEDFVEWWVKHFTLTDNVLFDFSKLDGEQ